MRRFWLPKKRWQNSYLKIVLSDQCGVSLTREWGQFDSRSQTSSMPLIKGWKIHCHQCFLLYIDWAQNLHMCLLLYLLKSFKGHSFAFNHILVNAGTAISLFNGCTCNILSSEEPNASLRLVIPILWGQEQEQELVKARGSERMRKDWGSSIFSSVKSCPSHCLNRGLPRGRDQQ